jgi:endonuclease YncB( thermonuclease family)
MARGIWLLLVVTSAATLALATEIYTWTDADGIKHFSNLPPASEHNANVIDVEPTPAAADPAAARARAMQQLERQRQAVEALRRAQNPPRAPSQVSRQVMTAQEYEQARQGIRAAWQNKDINKAREAALYLDLERRRLGLASIDAGGSPVQRSNASDITGHAYVIDGDTLDISGTRIRLFGMDAMEKSQVCARPHEQWPCGQQATVALRQRIGSTMIQCSTRDRDKHDRTVAVCDVAGEDLSAWMVRQGWAVAYTRYSRDYVAQETEARALKRNIWSGTFVAPEEYRHGGN